MILSVTVNLGNYESVRLESSEYPTVADCRAELDKSLAKFGEPRIDDFRKRITTVEV